jgi:exonuclease VII large subunit
MTTSEIISLSASIASLVLAIVAIWLSFAFFRMSSTLSASTTKAAENIASSVQKLEALFDRLYSDTFSMMRDTVSDMRKHIWPEESLTENKVAEEAEKRANGKVAILQEKMDKEVTDILERQKIAEDKLNSVRNKMQELLHDAIQETRQADNDKQKEILIFHILTHISAKKIKAIDLTSMLHEEFPNLRLRLGSVFQDLREAGLISWDGEQLMPKTMIGITKKGRMELELQPS